MSCKALNHFSKNGYAVETDRSGKSHTHVFMSINIDRRELCLGDFIESKTKENIGLGCYSCTACMHVINTNSFCTIALLILIDSHCDIFSGMVDSSLTFSTRSMG